MLRSIASHHIHPVVRAAPRSAGSRERSDLRVVPSVQDASGSAAPTGFDSRLATDADSRLALAALGLGPARRRAQMRAVAPVGGLAVTSRIGADGVTLVLHGEIDIASVHTLESELQNAERSRPRQIVLDLCALSFIGSTGIHLLAGAQQRAEVNGYGFLLTNVPDHARRLFRLIGFRPQLVVA